jgi:hypothetical protein
MVAPHLAKLILIDGDKAYTKTVKLMEDTEYNETMLHMKARELSRDWAYYNLGRHDG